MNGGEWLRRALLLGLAGAIAESRGRAVYEQYCVACHGTDAAGAMPGVSDLTDAAGPLAKDDVALFAAVRDGLSRPGGALSMPPRGGNPALADEELRAVLRYVRKLAGVPSQ